MGQSRDSRAWIFLFCAAVLLLSLSAAFCADPTTLTAPEAAPSAPPEQTEQTESPAAPQTPPPPWAGDLRTRSQLTGDWAGRRDTLAEHGMTFFGDITQYYQGVATGGRAQRFEYGGRGDYLFDFDSTKMGLWKGGHLDLRAETRLGQDCNVIDGVISPSNFAMALPRPNQDLTAITGLQYTQDFGERVSVFLGKLNLLDGTAAAYARGVRLDYFWNAAMQSNLCRNYLIPSALGTGFTVRKDGEPALSFFLLDTHYTPTTSGFSTLFDNGVLLYGEYRLKTNWFDRPGHSVVGFLYSTATRSAIDTNPYVLLNLVLSGQPIPTKNSSWTATYRIDQVLYADPDNPKRNWSVNCDLGLTDGNPNPIRWFVNASLLGASPIRRRERDTIGVGYYHLGVSEVPLLTIHGFGDENGVEVFYNAAVTPWFHITSDLQVLDPAQIRNPTTLLFGIRARLSF